MRYVTASSNIVFFSLFSCAVFAVDIPQDVMGSEKFDATMCVSENTQNCIDSVCLTSEEIDCEANCQTMAQQKCQEQSNE